MSTRPSDRVALWLTDDLLVELQKQAKAANLTPEACVRRLLGLPDLEVVPARKTPRDRPIPLPDETVIQMRMYGKVHHAVVREGLVWLPDHPEGMSASKAAKVASGVTRGLDGWGAWTFDHGGTLLPLRALSRRVRPASHHPNEDWTDPQLVTLREKYGTMPNAELARLLDKSVGSIRSAGHRFNLTKKRTPKETPAP